VKKVLVKFDEETNPDWGCAPSERSISEYIRLGFVNVDKPAGPTSHQVSAWVKGILGVKKAGHSGTLDPQVTGVLPVGLLDATKALRTLLLSGKEYVCLMRLHGSVTDAKLRDAFGKFTGEIQQKPPVKSAVKRQMRTRKIYEIEFIERKDTLVLFRVSCEAGTYIRKLCHDMGQTLGVGAHMQRLRRTKAGSFSEKNAVILQNLADAVAYYREGGKEDELRKLVVPVEEAVSHLPRIWLRDSAVSSIAHGATLKVPGIAKLEDGIKKGDTISLFTLKGELAATARAEMTSSEITVAEHGEAAKPERIIINADAYPRQWKKKE
jgi:H/ACA ribonucleoprotein complex subunit 4